MRVVVPFTRLHRPVLAALSASGFAYELADTSRSDRAYFDLLRGLWEDAATFCIVEHDIIVSAGCLSELADCPGEWCGLPHRYHGRIEYGLGCVKFTDRLIARHPDAVIRAGVLHSGRCPKRHWYGLNTSLQGTILRSERKCHHPTVLTHLGHT